MSGPTYPPPSHPPRSSRWAQRGLVVLVGVLGLVVVVLVVTLVVLVGSDEDGVATDPAGSEKPTAEATDPETDLTTDPTTEPTADPTTTDVADGLDVAAAAAVTFLNAINTYGPDDLDADDRMPGYSLSVVPLLTADLADEFRQSVRLAEQSVAQAGLARSNVVYAAGVSSLDDDTAQVLVAGAQRQSYPDPQGGARIESEPTPYRYVVDLVLGREGWLVDDFAPVQDGTDVGAGVLPPEAAAARARAAEAAAAVLAYDYRDLDASHDAAVAFMTDDYAAEYDTTFGVVRENAPTTRTVVTATVQAAGVSSALPRAVDVLVFVDRPTRSGSKSQVYRDQATFSMVLLDGEWYVDGVETIR